MSPSFSSTFKALRHPNFRLFFAGQTVSLTGTWVQSVAQSWLVYRMTDSPFLLGLAGFMGQIPVFILGLFGGVVADRFNRHRIILVTQTLAMVQAAILAVLVLTNTIRVWEIFVLGFLLGTISAFDLPARQSFFIEMVGKQDLPNAIALNSSAVNIARLLGPVGAGLLVGIAGEGICFLVNALSFLAVLAGLLLMKVSPPENQRFEVSLRSYLLEGILYGARTAVIRRALMFLSLLSLMALPYSIILPVFSRTVLESGADIYGLLMGGVGLGALLGTLSMARTGPKSLEKVIFGAGLGTGIFFALFAFSKTVPVSFVLMAGMGYCLMTHFVATNMLLQSVVPDNFRGRLMSFYGFVLLGIAPFGSLLSGFIVHQFGASRTVFFSGVALVFGALAYYRQSFARTPSTESAGTGGASGEIIGKQ